MVTNKNFSNMGNIDHYNRSHKNLSVLFFPFRELTPCCTFLKKYYFGTAGNGAG